MNASLQEDLQRLLSQYPELQNASVTFSGAHIAINSGIEPNTPVSITSRSTVPFCESVEAPPDVIKGPSAKIEVRKSKIHGYGVFARETIELGETVEECRLLRLGWRKNYQNDPVLEDYVWDILCDCKECEKHGRAMYLTLGFGSLYNHSDTPNATMSPGHASGVRTIRANKIIQPNEEIFVSYGKKYFLVRNFLRNAEKNRLLEQYLEKNKKSED